MNFFGSISSDFANISKTALLFLVGCNETLHVKTAGSAH